ncbi:MAG TPA: hypothetical protein VL484_02465 [Vicinamibacterales bacterium]|nr:hypothetical protein [Vicinamibacterales bacterium]
MVPRPCEAQLSNLVPKLILEGITTAGGENPGLPHAGHFTLEDPTFGGSQAASQIGAVGQQAVLAVVTFNDRMRSQLANFPLGSSSGGFTYTFDPSTGAYIRSSSSFGPSFTERALTLGRRRASFGMNYQHTTFSSFGGEDLHNGSIAFYLPHTDCCNATVPPPSPLTPGFEGDWMEAALDISTTTDTFAFFANYGVTDRLDVGVAIPFTHVSLDTTVHATILRLATGAHSLVHTFATGQDVITKDFTSSGTASGVGDIVLRTKYSLYHKGSSAVAAALDLRLPSGDSDNLLGIGTTQGKMYVIASAESGMFSPHVNFGYTASGSGDKIGAYGVPVVGVSDEVNYAGGVDFIPAPQFTVTGDIIGRTLRGAGSVEAQTISLQYSANATSTTNPISGQPYRELAFTPGNLNLVLGAAGVKYNPTGNVLLTGSVLFPFTSGGLKSKVSFVLGVDIAFGQ